MNLWKCLFRYPGHRFALPRLWIVGLLALTLRGRAQTPDATTVGSIEGRVLQPATGDYLETAQVIIEGTSLEAFTDSGGNYRLINVPAGPVRVRAFFSGLLPQTDTVTVMPNQTQRHDFRLMAAGDKTKLAADGAPLKLDEFVVAASREMSAAALAINEPTARRSPTRRPTSLIFRATPSATAARIRHAARSASRWIIN